MEVDVSSNFFLLAAINRNFRREFTERVLYDMFKLHRVIRQARELLACGLCKSAVEESHVGSTGPGQQGNDLADLENANEFKLNEFDGDDLEERRQRSVHMDES